MEDNQVNQLNKVISDADHIETFLASPAWLVVEQLVKSKVEEYKNDAFTAARSTSQNLAAYLGRMESLEWFLNTVQFAYTQAKRDAIAMKESYQEQLKQQDILDSEVHETIVGPIYKGTHAGLM